MQGWALALIVGALIACLAPPSASSLNMNNICVLLKDNAAIASISDCTTYYTCSNGIATMQQCPTGSIFNKDIQNCVQSSEPSSCQANGNGNGNDPCQGRVVGSFAPVLGSCEGYYYCGANGTGGRGNCPSGENFNPSTQSCVYADQYPCAEETDPNDPNDSEIVAVNLCEFIENGIYFGSPSSCASWNICHNNMMKTGLCPVGYVFDPTVAECGPQSAEKCQQVTNDPNIIGTIGGPCSTAGLKRKGTACTNYFVCDGVNYQLKQCDGELFYDTINEMCVQRLQARNDCDRCIGSVETFVNAYSTSSCAGYLICSGGVETGSGQCPSGFYFDELSSACIANVQPLYGCCNPNSTTTSPQTPAVPITSV